MPNTRAAASIVQPASVLVSPHRFKCPWQDQQEAPEADFGPAYDPTCCLCPSNFRTSGEVNPAYASTLVYDNDFQAP